MYFHSPEELQKIVPISDGVWNKEYLYEYLVWYQNTRFTEAIDRFFAGHLQDEHLADLLFSFLLNEDHDGSDSQMGAARVLAHMDRDVLRAKRDLLLRAQENAVLWKRPFPGEKDLDWL